VLEINPLCGKTSRLCLDEKISKGSQWIHPIPFDIHVYLVGGLEHFLFFHILGIIIPTG
jgi:hypothetical protein